MHRENAEYCWQSTKNITAHSIIVLLYSALS